MISDRIRFDQISVVTLRTRKTDLSKQSRADHAAECGA